VNGRFWRDPEAPVSGKKNEIAVDGKVIEPVEKLYLMMNKPRGAVTTASDEKGRETVYAMLNAGSWVSPVGRLDKAARVCCC